MHTYPFICGNNNRSHGMAGYYEDCSNHSVYLLLFMLIVKLAQIIFCKATPFVPGKLSSSGDKASDYAV